ncbi:MAG: DUF6073 family protein [Acidimicrobiales bacterium]
MAILLVGALIYALNPGARGLSSSPADFHTGSFPPAGTDSFNSSADVEVQAPCNTGPTFDVNLFGPTKIQRGNPSIDPNTGLDTIATSMTFLDLTGYNPTLGNIKVKLNRKRASKGMVTADSPSSDFPATSYFDIFFDIETSGVKHGLPKMDLFNKQTVQMTGGDDIMSLPPIGTVYSGESVPLWNSRGAEVGCVVSAQHVPSIDDFKCYTATATGFTPPSSVSLENQFNTTGFQATPEAVTDHCNPVQEGPPKDRSIISNPDAHLLCWSIATSTQSTFTVSVTNQFGTAELTTGQPTTLCLPSWKSLTGPPDQPAVQPPGLDHFLCYPVTYVPGTPPFQQIPPVALKDEFGTFHATVGAPTQLCLPTQKTVNNVVTPITDVTNQLLCFAISTHGKPRTVFDQNQFGTGQVAVNMANNLCLQSEKTIIP